MQSVYQEAYNAGVVDLESRLKKAVSRAGELYPDDIKGQLEFTAGYMNTDYPGLSEILTTWAAKVKG